jgi:hypothetical protein
LYVITEYQYQQLRNTCKEAFVDEIGRQPLKEESQIKAEMAALANEIKGNSGYYGLTIAEILKRMWQILAV